MSSDGDQPVPGDLVWFNSGGGKETGIILRAGMYASPNCENLETYLLIMWNDDGAADKTPRPTPYELIPDGSSQLMMTRSWEPDSHTNWYRAQTDVGHSIFKVISRAG